MKIWGSLDSVNQYFLKSDVLAFFIYSITYVAETICWARNYNARAVSMSRRTCSAAAAERMALMRQGNIKVLYFCCRLHSVKKPQQLTAYITATQKKFSLIISFEDVKRVQTMTSPCQISGEINTMSVQNRGLKANHKPAFIYWTSVVRQWNSDNILSQERGIRLLLLYVHWRQYWFGRWPCYTRDLFLFLCCSSMTTAASH